MKKSIVFFAVFIALMANTSDVFSQTGESSLFLNRGSQYHLGTKDQILMNVNVWGYVQKPGQYVVPRNTDLISLISFAGGPREGANLSEVTIIRGGIESAQYAQNGVNSSRTGLNKKVPILIIDVKDNLKNGDMSKIPLLEAGDTVVIKETGGHKFQNVLGINSMLSIIAALASVALIVERL